LPGKLLIHIILFFASFEKCHFVTKGIVIQVLTISVLRPLAAIVLGHFSGNFIHAIKNSNGL
jgi:hypothetical protein